MHPSKVGRRIGLAAIAALLLVPATAQARVTGAEITAVDGNDAAEQVSGVEVNNEFFDVELRGTATLVDAGNDPDQNDLDLFCYGDGHRHFVQSVDVDLVNKTWGPEVVELPDLCHGDAPTVLRAVPDDDQTAGNPDAQIDTPQDESDPEGSALDAFPGLPITVHELENETVLEEFVLNPGGLASIVNGIAILLLDEATVPNVALHSFDLDTVGTKGGFEINALGDGSIDGSSLYTGTNFVETGDDNFLSGILELDDEVGGASDQASLLVDGERALPVQEQGMINGIDAGPLLSDIEPLLPALDFTPLRQLAAPIVDAAGEIKLGHTQTLRVCRDDNGDKEGTPSFDANTGLSGDYCGEMPSSGIDVARTHETLNDGLQVKVTDVYTNTTNQAKEIVASYENDFEDDSRFAIGNGPFNVDDEYGLLDFASASRAGGPVSLLVESDEDEADGDTDEQTAAITWVNDAPDLGYFQGEDELVAEFTRTVPAGGSITIEHIVSQANDIEAIRDLAGLAEGPDVVPTPTLPTEQVVTIVQNTTTTRNTTTTVPGPATTVVQQSASRARTCRVPRLRGRSRLSAERAIVRAGCSVGKVRIQKSRKYKKGRVISQSVRAGRIVAGGRSVQLRVSRGKVRTKKARRSRR